MPALNLSPPLACPGMRVGLLGGTFDPPHEGHLHISETVLKRLGLDRLWWLVTPGNPLKDRAGVTHFEKRLKAAQDYVHHPRIDVTGFEAQLGNAYSAQTISFLVKRFPETHFVWVMGADNLAAFHHWYMWREILATLPVAVVDRPGYRFAAVAGQAAQAFARYRIDESDAAGLWRYHAPAWSLLTLPLSALSSTQLRSAKQ